jgi:prepilin-type N-terminal cleavage/methylation domain-containing protein
MGQSLFRDSRAASNVIGIHRSNRLRPASFGMTLVELLVVISIIGVLVSLLLPAVMMAREASRRTQCQNNIRQLSFAVIQGESAFKVFPSGGWGWRWVAEPDRGYGVKQVGSWIYQILPFIEGNNIQNIGQNPSAAVKRLELATLTKTPLSVVRCPTRASVDFCPVDPGINWHNSELANGFFRSDYVGNGGSFFEGILEGPSSLSQGDSTSFVWPINDKQSGIFFQRSTIRPSSVTDGLSTTYLLSEKYVSTIGYKSYGDFGYDQPYVVGFDWDTIRWTSKTPLNDGKDPDPERMGSPHGSGFSASYCDGSVRMIPYSIEAKIHSSCGSRNDGQGVQAPE